MGTSLTQWRSNRGDVMLLRLVFSAGPGRRIVLTGNWHLASPEKSHHIAGEVKK
jgi:hypothetical protein